MFDYLEATHPDLQIINGSELDGTPHHIDITNGSDITFRSYYTTSVTTTVEPYGFTNTSGYNIQGIDICTDSTCDINKANIRTMTEAGYLIDAEGKSIKTNKIP